MTRSWASFGMALMAGLALAAIAGTSSSADPSPAALECRALGLSHCPQPFDPVLPAAEDMLNWNQDSLPPLSRRYLPHTGRRGVSAAARAFRDAAGAL
jgi:hypothetical protein